MEKQGERFCLKEILKISPNSCKMISSPKPELKFCACKRCKLFLSKVSKNDI